MNVKSIKYLFILVALLLTVPTHADAFTTVKLPGITLDIPSHWKVMDKNTALNLMALSEAIIQNADVEGSDKKSNLLTVTSLPYPISAMIRVTVATPPTFNQNNLLHATPDDMAETSTEIFKMLKLAEKISGIKIISMEDVSIDKIGGLLALKVTYIREDMEINNEHWSVTQYRVPLKNYYYTITLSYNLSASHLFEPILEKVKRSISFQ